MQPYSKRYSFKDDMRAPFGSRAEGLRDADFDPDGIEEHQRVADI